MMNKMTNQLTFALIGHQKLLRSKANFGILEGFLSELLREDIRIMEILESEGNKDTGMKMSTAWIYWSKTPGNNDHH